MPASCSNARATARTEARARDEAAPERRDRTEVVRGIARVDRRTKDLAKRIGRGEIAIIDHRDIDRVAGESLVAAGVGAVVNANASISGRYPNGGPIRIVQAGIPLLDDVGDDVMDVGPRRRPRRAPRRRALARRREGRARRDARGSTRSKRAWRSARQKIGVELRHFAENTLEYMEKEAELTFEPLELPTLRVQIRGRHAVVVVRGHDYQHDLRTLRPYIKEYQPVLIAVDGGADALLEVGLTPDIIIGDFDSLSDRAWSCGAELVHHVHPDGRGPGREELQARGVALRGVRRRRDERRRRDAARVRGRRDAHRRRRDARDDGRVPRQGPAGHGVDVPHPTAPRSGARRREGREPPVRRPYPAARHVAARRRRHWPRWS